MKYYPLMLLLFLASTGNIVGQDRMVLRDSSSIDCKIEEIGEEKIRYLKWTNLLGPLYSIDKTKVSHILFQNGSKEIFSKPRHVPHTLMVRTISGLYTPLNIEVNTIGGKGISFASLMQISAFLNTEKTISLSTTFYVAGGEFTNVHYEGARLNYFAYGFNTKWDYHWLRWTTGSLYSGLGVGFIKEDYTYNPNTSEPIPRKFREDRSTVGYQVSLVGVQYAPFRHIGFIAELGLGYEGIFKLGYQFHW